MKTQLEIARSGEVTDEMRIVSQHEMVDLGDLRMMIAEGKAVIMTREGQTPLGIGKLLSTKINANIGSSSTEGALEDEVLKARVAEQFGADTISDLSMGPDIDETRLAIIGATTRPLTTVPIYQTLVESGSFKGFSPKDIIRTVKKHAGDGVSSIVVHAGFDLQMLESLRKEERIMGMVSKGGSFTAAWMLEHGADNPYNNIYEEVLAICRQHDIVLSLGNTMRSGCIHDFRDDPQVDEIRKNTELAKAANNAGVQVIVEGLGGHINASDIPGYVEQHKLITGGRPLFVAGPLPTDVAVGYDHIAAAVGGSIASGAGADYLCYITPSEHLALPNSEQVREGVVAFRIAAHIGDSIKHGLSERDKMLAINRRELDWAKQMDYAIEPERARKIKETQAPGECTMCGNHCAIKIMDKHLRK